MKKLFTLFLAFVTSVGLIIASDTQVDSIWYDFDTVALTATVSYQGARYNSYSNEYSDDITIPSTVSYNNLTYRVTSIGERAFQNCSSLTAITIPNSVTNIGNYAFSGCSGLTSVIIPNSITIIGNGAFYLCSGLSSVCISDVAAWCGITFGNESANPLHYAHKLYLNGELLTNIIVPSSVTNIGSYAFYECSSLTSIIIPNGVTSISEYTFSGCSGLTSVTIPNSVTRIGYEAFSSCSRLTSVSIPNGVTRIDGYAFLYCSGLISVTIPNGVTSISSTAFSGCYLLEINYDGSATGYPWGATIIDERTQDGIIIKDNSTVKYVGTDSIVTIPNGVTSIGVGTFLNCTILRSITIPSSVISIGNQAFRGCSGLMSITCEATIPPTVGSNVFSNYNIPCYVPMESVSYYRIANQWQNFGTNIQGYYLVTFQDWDGTELSKDHVTAGASAVGPTKEPTREGYVFIGWDSDLDSITSDLVVTAQYTIFYPVIFLDWKGIVLLRDTIAQDSAATAPAAPVREGYEFIGWSQDFSNIQGELYVIAQYEKVPEPVEGILVTYTDGVDNAVIGNDTIVLNIPEAPVHSGYTFLSWMTVVGNPEDGITIKAIYQEDSPTNVQQESAVPQSDESRKIFENGNVYILRDGKTYTIQGQEVKQSNVTIP